ncbi:MAG: cob(I)yrinic acid a,c-diamide adenosyltransferase [Clostridiales bacterium]|nr:cob(I)yrinic acid a,c-diamide adenosyltransferase [Clostridiales bacterium]
MSGCNNDNAAVPPAASPPGAGLVHVYIGDGKGKTTAAIGLAVRSLGRGRAVAVAQFLKSGGSGEISLLRKLDLPIQIFTDKSLNKFSFNMNAEEKEACRACHMTLFRQAAEHCESGRVDLLVLDEILNAIQTELFPEKDLIAFLSRRPANLEVVLTGRQVSDAVAALADYVTNLQKIKHPYDRGVSARIGIEM